MSGRTLRLKAAGSARQSVRLLLCGLSLVAAGCYRPVPTAVRPSTNVAAAPMVAISSPFENTRSGVEYLGSEACRKCHSGHAEFYHCTGMGRSMSTVELAQTPPDGSFDHAPSQLRYQVSRRNGKLWHRELTLTSRPEEAVLSEYPVTWVVGSGRHSLTYIAEADGFLVESPITWYAATKAWGMSPRRSHRTQGELSLAEGLSPRSRTDRPMSGDAIRQRSRPRGRYL
jgi:hypothetical protein